jgi:hypothetical protein
MGQFCIFPYIFFPWNPFDLLPPHISRPFISILCTWFNRSLRRWLSGDQSSTILELSKKGKKEEKNGYYKERLDGEAIALLGLLGESAMGTQQQQRGAPEHTDSGQVAVCVCSRETRRYLSQVIGKVRIWARSNRSDICMGYLYIHMDTHTRRCVSLLDVSSYSSHTAMYI